MVSRHKTGSSAQTGLVEYVLPFLAVLMCMLVVVAHVYSVQGARGSDQYWYLSDVATLVDNKPPLTNTVFPGDLLRGNSADTETYFAHNGPLLHIVASLARYTDAVFAWKYLNLLFLLLGALLTALAVSHLTSARAGFFTFILFLATPVHVWLSVNFLQETFFCLLSACVLYAAVTGIDTWRGRLILLVSLFLGALSHPLYTVVGICLAIYLAHANRKFVLPLLLVTVTLLAQIMKSSWFPTSFPPSVLKLVSASIPGIANSLWQLTDTVVPISLGLILDKLKHALTVQFLPTPQSPMYLVSNIGLVALLVLLLRRIATGRLFLYLSAVFMLAYAGMVVLMQNQMRYQLLISPFSIACLMVWLSSWKRIRATEALLFILIAAYVLIDMKMYQKVRQESLADSVRLERVRQELAFVQPDDRVALLGGALGGWIPTIHVLKPLPAMPVMLEVLSEESRNRVLSFFEPDFLLAKGDIEMTDFPQARYLKTIEGPGSAAIEVYEVD